MTTIDVVADHGAVGDGKTDDSQAIQNAINATGTGDTVLIPETSDYYRIKAGSAGPQLNIESAADDVTITGESKNSRLVVDRTTTTGISSVMGVEDMSNANWTSISIKKLVFDGGKNEVNNDDTVGFAFRVDQDRTGYDVLMEDCVFKDAATRSGTVMGGSEGISRITYRSCTATNNDTHGFDPVGTGEGTADNPECEFINVEASNNSIGIDFHSGNHLLDGFYGTGNANGLKAGAAGGPVNHITMKNVNHRNSGNQGFYQSFSETGWSLDLEDCLFTGHPKDGLELRNECTCTVTGGTLMVDNCGVDTPHNITVIDGSSFESTNATVISQNANNGTGFNEWNGGDVHIGTYYHYNNDEGGIGSNDITIDEKINEESAEIGVPGPDDVGAFASGSNDDDSGDSVDDDDSGDSVDDDDSSDPVFDDWTPRWNSGDSDWAVNSMSSNVEDSTLELNAGSAGRHALSCGPIGTATDVDILGLVRVPSDDDSSSSWCRLVGRGAGSAGNETGYFIHFLDVPDFGIAKYVDGNSTGLTSESVDFTPGNWFYVRFNISGNELKARYWGVDQQEPSDWLLETTDDDISGSGWVGVGGFSTDTQQWDVVSVATGGESAQLLIDDRFPTVSVNNPLDGDTVSGNERVEIEGSDEEDSNDSLTAEYRIDDGNWTSLSYNEDSGFYEDSWDTTTVDDGDHTIEAAVVDSAGNESTTAVSVTTNNAGTSPAVDSLSAVEIETDNPDAEFDVDWQVSDADGDLNETVIELVQDSEDSLQDSTTVAVSGDSDSGSTRLVAEGGDGSDNSYTATLQITDSGGNTASSTTSIVESEETNAPEIDRFSVSEAGRPDPHAEVMVVWDVSDRDGDLASANIKVADSNGTVQGVTWTLNGATAHDTDSFKIKSGDGNAFDVSLTVTDTAGETTSKTVSVTA